MKAHNIGFAIFVLGCIATIILSGINKAEADGSGPWHVTIDGKGRSAIMWNEDTGEMFVSNRLAEKYALNGTFTLWWKVALPD